MAVQHECSVLCVSYSAGLWSLNTNIDRFQSASLVVSSVACFSLFSLFCTLGEQALMDVRCVRARLVCVFAFYGCGSMLTVGDFLYLQYCVNIRCILTVIPILTSSLALRRPDTPRVTSVARSLPSLVSMRSCDTFFRLALFKGNIASNCCLLVLACLALVCQMVFTSVDDAWLPLTSSCF